MRRNCCYSLVELIIASVILLIAIIGVPTFYVTNRRNLRNARMRRLATWHAAGKMEELKSEPYGTLEDGSDTVDMGDEEGEREWTVEPVTDHDSKKVSVKISWGDSSDMELVTIVSKLPGDQP